MNQSLIDSKALERGLRRCWGALVSEFIFLYLGLVLRDPCGLGNPFLPQKIGEDI